MSNESKIPKISKNTAELMKEDVEKIQKVALKEVALEAAFGLFYAGFAIYFGYLVVAIELPIALVIALTLITLAAVYLSFRNFYESYQSAKKYRAAKRMHKDIEDILGKDHKSTKNSHEKSKLRTKAYLDKMTNTYLDYTGLAA